MVGRGGAAFSETSRWQKRKEINYAWCVLEAVKRFDGEISLADELAKKARI